jgi:anti-anti-sigma regulatory factor
MNASFADGKLTLSPQTEKGAEEFERLRAWLSKRSVKDNGGEIVIDLSVLQRHDESTVQASTATHDGSG